MQKKRITAKKAPLSSKKIAPSSKKRAPSAKKRVPAAGNHPVFADKKHDGLPSTHHTVGLLPSDVMDGARDDISRVFELLKEFMDADMTARERRRKVGAGIKIYGFIDKVSDFAASNPEMAWMINVESLKNCIRNIEECRNIIVMLQGLERMVSNTMAVNSHDAYQMSLIFYSMAREMARRGDPNATAVFDELQPFFRKTKRAHAEPTAKELERDARALMAGRKEGRIVIEHESPRMTAGKHTVIDQTRKVKKAFRATQEAEIDDY